MPISGVGSSDSYYPTNTPPNGNAAFSFITFGKLSEISGSLAASGASRVGATGGDSSATLYAEMQALTDLAKMHMFLLSGDTKDALACANDFMSLQKQCDPSDPNISAVYQQVASYFTMSNGQVTGFQNDKAGNSFSTWWTTGSSANSNTAGAQYEMDWLGSLSSQSVKLYPSTSPSSYTPGVFVDLCLMYADAMTIPSIAKTGIDTSFWGNSGLSSFNFAQLFPYAAAAYAYQMTFIDPNGDKSWDTYHNMMNNMAYIISQATVQCGASPTQYPNLYNAWTEFNNVNYQAQFPNGGWPLPGPVPGIDPTQWAILQHYLSLPDLGPFYQNVLADLYGQFMYGNP